MKNQIAAFLDVLWHPKRTMQELPSDRLYALAVLAHLYYAVDRAFNPRNHALLHDKLGGNIQIVLFVLVITVVLLPVSGWLMQQVLRLFGKRLSVFKILNISGYAYAPRVLSALTSYLVLFVDPTLFMDDRPSPSIIAIIVLGVVSMIYALFLCIYGFVVSPSEGVERIADDGMQANDSVKLCPKCQRECGDHTRICPRCYYRFDNTERLN